MTAEHEVRALLATRYADLADRASTAGDGPGLLRAGDKLLELMDTLPIRGQGVNPGDGGGIGAGGERERLTLVLDGPPTVGDTADG